MGTAHRNLVVFSLLSSAVAQAICNAETTKLVFTLHSRAEMGKNLSLNDKWDRLESFFADK